MSNRKKYLGISIAFLIIGFVIGNTVGLSDPLTPTLDPDVGIYDFSWLNSTVGVSTVEYYKEGFGNYSEWIESLFDDLSYEGNYTTVRKNSGANIGNQTRLNFIEGENVTLSISDDPSNEEIDITITSTGGTGGVTDHGALTGLGDDDHPQYLMEGEVASYLNEMGCTFYIGLLSVSGTDYVYVLNGSSGDLLINGTDQRDIFQWAINQTSLNAAGDLEYNTTLRVIKQAVIYVGPGNFSLGDLGLFFVNRITFRGTGPASTILMSRITIPSGVGGVINPMWGTANKPSYNFTYGVSIEDICFQSIVPEGTGDYGIQWDVWDATMPTIFNRTGVPAEQDISAGMLKITNVILKDYNIPVNTTNNMGGAASFSARHVFANGIWYINRIFDASFHDIFMSSLKLSKASDTYWSNIYLGVGGFELYGGTAEYPSHGNHFTLFKSDNSGDGQPAIWIYDYAYYNYFSVCEIGQLGERATDNVTSAVHLGPNTQYTSITTSKIGNNYVRTNNPAGTSPWLYLIYEESGTGNNTFQGNLYILGNASYGGRDLHYSEDGPHTSDLEGRKRTFYGSADSILNTANPLFCYPGGFGIESTTAQNRMMMVQLAGYFTNWVVRENMAPGAGKAWQWNLTLAETGAGLSSGQVDYYVNVTDTNVWAKSTGYYYHDPGPTPDLFTLSVYALGTPTATAACWSIDYYPDLEDLLYGKWVRGNEFEFQIPN